MGGIIGADNGTADSAAAPETTSLSGTHRAARPGRGASGSTGNSSRSATADDCNNAGRGASASDTSGTGFAAGS